MDRRDFLLTSAAAASLPLLGFHSASTSPWSPVPQKAQGRVSPVDPRASISSLELHRAWHGPVCHSSLHNGGRQPVQVREIVLLDLRHSFSGATEIYGESFQMLSETVGTLAAPKVLGLGDSKHYHIPQPFDATVAVGLLTLTPPEKPTELLAFTSCRRFIGRFYLRPQSLQVVLDAEGLEIAPGETWQLEDFIWLRGEHRPALLAELARHIQQNHPTLSYHPVPTGWCSWPVVGTHVTADAILEQVRKISQTVQGLRFIQIDDGYEPALGDWLDTRPGFGKSIGDTLLAIRDAGFTSGIWGAPFVATPDSHLFQQHPDWFIRHKDRDTPLQAKEVSFGGWHRGDWYALDGTHPEVLQFFTKLFHTMRQQWDCRYFKLDALFWGALHGGRFHDPKATRIEAYRRGMQAIRQGAGADSFILGCNHPIWPSLGLIHGSRSSGDISRHWNRFRDDARQTLLRNWQNGQLWWNDPDTIELTGKNLSDDEFMFHATAIFASGGLVLDGDDVTKIPAQRMEWLKKLLPPTGVAAEFPDTSLRVGTVRHGGKVYYCCFNAEDTAQTRSFRLPGRRRLEDFWSGQDLGEHRGRYTLTLPPHSGRVIACKG